MTLIFGPKEHATVKVTDVFLTDMTGIKKEILWVWHQFSGYKKAFWFIKT